MIDIDNHFDNDLIFDLNFEYMINPPFYKNAIYKLILDDDWEKKLDINFLKCYNTNTDR